MRKAAPTRAADLMQQVARDITTMAEPHVRALLPALHAAEKETTRALDAWLRAHPDGAARFTAQQYRAVLLQLREAMRAIERLTPAMFSALNGGVRTATNMAQSHLAAQLEQFGLAFGDPIHLPLKVAGTLAAGQRSLIDANRSSARRYAGDVGADIKRQLAIGMVRGETIHQLTNRLQRLGPFRPHALGPAAPTPVAQQISAGIFQRQRWRAERVVRTEVISAYNVQSQRALEVAHAEEPGLQQRWDAAADRRLCPICRDLDGVVVDIGKQFPGGLAHPPAHPCCRCALTPWHKEWREEKTGGTLEAD